MRFNGGIHPPYNKELTEGSKIQIGKIPERVVVPLSQHIGLTCEPVVKVGDKVKKGQKIGESPYLANGKIPVSAPVHTSISGIVASIGPSPHPAGSEVPSISIDSDGTDEWIEGLTEREDYLSIEPEELKHIIYEAGIVGLGGAAFPTHAKLNPPPDKKIRNLILNGAECEPYLTTDHRLMVDRSKDIIQGLKIMMKILSVESAYIGIEENKPDAIEMISEVIEKEPTCDIGVDVYRDRTGLERLISRRKGPTIEVVELETKYPQGAEKQLIKVILGREVPEGGLPMDVGVVVHNVGTAVAVYEAVRYGRPLIERVVTVSGPGIKWPKNLLARIGTPIRQLIEECGGFVGGPGKVIVGGPMMGVSQYTLDVPVVKGTSGIIVFPREYIESEDSNPCIRCGMCVRACPMKLMPNMIALYAELDMPEEAKRYHPLDCIECGCCAYVCPAKRPLVQLIRYAKREILNKKKKVASSK